VPRANITSTGLFTAGTITGTFTEEVSASTGGVTRFATVIVQSTTPGRNPSASMSFLDSLSSFDSLVGIASGALIASVVGAFFYSRKGKGQVGKRNGRVSTVFDQARSP